MIRPPGIKNGAFVVTPDSVWYARVLLLFSASAQTDTGSKIPNRSTVLLCRRWKHMTILKMVIIDVIVIIVIFVDISVY